MKLGSAQGYSMTCRRQEYSVVHDEPESESLCTEQLLSRAESTIEVAWSLAIEPSPGRAASEASEPTSASAVGRMAGRERRGTATREGARPGQAQRMTADRRLG